VVSGQWPVRRSVGSGQWAVCSRKSFMNVKGTSLQYFGRRASSCLLVTGHWSLATDNCPLPTGHWPLATGHCPA
jgi:hypothetical protein